MDIESGKGEEILAGDFVQQAVQNPLLISKELTRLHQDLLNRNAELFVQRFIRRRGAK